MMFDSPLRHRQEPPGFSDWLSGQLGTRRWAVAARRPRGYTVGISPKRYTAFRNEWLGLVMARLFYRLPPPPPLPTKVRCLDLADSEAEPYECELDDALPDPDDFAAALEELRRTGQALVGGGAAPAYRITTLEVFAK